MFSLKHLYTELNGKIVVVIPCIRTLLSCANSQIYNAMVYPVDGLHCRPMSNNASYPQRIMKVYESRLVPSIFHTVPHASPHSPLELFAVLAPQLPRFDVGGTLIVGAPKHADDRQEDRLR